MTPRQMSLRAAALLAAALLLAALGCSPLPLAPKLSDDEQATLALTSALENGATGLAKPEIILPPVVVPDPGDTLISIRLVDGDQGARVQNGRVTLDLPPGAVEGVAEIKVIIPDSTKLHVLLEISGGAANHFDVPVTLTFDCAGVEDLDHQGVFWFNEALGRWVQIAGDIDRDRRVVTTPLSHFSEYKCEKTKLAKASW